MKRSTIITGAAVLVMALTITGAAHAGTFAEVKNWMTLEVLALVLSAAATVLGGALGMLFGRVARTFREAGEFLTALGAALEDSRITRDELALIIREGKEVFTLWS